MGDLSKAVMVWIYGGTDTGGSTADPLWNGQYLADQEDVVLVSMKYDSYFRDEIGTNAVKLST